MMPVREQRTWARTGTGSSLCDPPHHEPLLPAVPTSQRYHSFPKPPSRDRVFKHIVSVGLAHSKHQVFIYLRLTPSKQSTEVLFLKLQGKKTQTKQKQTVAKQEQKPKNHNNKQARAVVPTGQYTQLKMFSGSTEITNISKSECQHKEQTNKKHYIVHKHMCSCMCRYTSEPVHREV